MLSRVAKILDEASDPNKMVLCTSGDDEMDGTTEDAVSDEELSAEESLGGWSPHSPQRRSSLGFGVTASYSGSSRSARTSNHRIRQDLRLAKAAGFRVGHIGPLTTPGQESLVIVSCRIAKLGISEEALRAWQLAPNQYFILLVRYSEGYRTLEQLTTEEAWGPKTVKMRVGVGHRYTIGISDAIRSFSGTKTKGKEEDDLENGPSNPTIGFNPFFIGRPLDELMNNRLFCLLRYRLDRAFSWRGAENFYNDHEGRKISDLERITPEYWDDTADLLKILPELVTADHLTQKAPPFSFPLLAMQFALRHLVRCTEFCLVCHRKVEEDFEALKPYVCSNPLCLYQYIRLGFGPSIEHEIISQPHVVDLLISFCYSSAAAGRLRSFPAGMTLLVPSLSLIPSIRPLASDPAIPHAYPVIPTQPDVAAGRLASSCHGVSKTAVSSVGPVIHKARLDPIKKELLFSPNACIPRVGDWIFVSLPGTSEKVWHCKVIETLHPTVRLGPPIARNNFTFCDRINVPNGVLTQSRHQVDRLNQRTQQPALARSDVGAASNPPDILSSLRPANSTSLIDVEFIVYEQNFDSLVDKEKQTAICVLLETLPSVAEMKSFLQSNHGRSDSLQAWTDRISPAALGVLRWIIASNRSCIIQVDNQEGDGMKSEERVSGLPNWMQFRFAQGAPDKEQRFITAVREASKHQEYPTLFAWHGSPLPNWHGILREGLHFRELSHGRAFGNGVYHALDVSTSLAYSSRSGVFSNAAWRDWPHSDLRISEAIALNEVVNAPDKFVSKRPHLVIDQLDWIQSRYLFVRCNNMAGLNIQDTPPIHVYRQDPLWSPTGLPTGQPITIPVTAVSKSRRPKSNVARLGNKRVKTGMDTPESEFDNNAVLSDETDIEDIKVLLSEDEEALPSVTSNMEGQRTGAKAGSNTFKRPSKPAGTGFVAGTLDHSKLPLLGPPSYATPTATRTLQRELNNTLRVQEDPPHELGWYIDPDLITNVYQWIVELHSFDDQLPLAKDMKSKDLTSIVIEIRFGKDYPISPPFVRVIRPRFLSFMSGGGGHVTAGGALCMELLTNSGWSAASNIESVLLQVRLAISSTDPRPARLEPGPAREYGVSEAVEAFIRACNAHGVSFWSGV